MSGSSFEQKSAQHSELDHRSNPSPLKIPLRTATRAGTFARATAAAMVVACVPSQAADAVVLWVSPPVWLQTQQTESAMRAGATLDAPVIIVTGQGAGAGLRVGGQDIVLSGETVWQLPSRDAGIGNVMQGGMNTRRLLGERGAAPANSVRCDGPWTLRLGPPVDRASATRMAAYLDRAGYPAQPHERSEAASDNAWWVRLAGYADASSAIDAGRKLVAAVPGLSQVAVEEQRPTTGCVP